MNKKVNPDKLDLQNFLPGPEDGFRPQRQVILFELCFFLDANCVNARQQNDALNVLERWRDQEIVTLIYAEITKIEASYGDEVRKDKADEFTCVQVNETGDNPEVREAISKIVFPKGPRNQNQMNDVDAVYHAERLRWPLVTMDGNSRSQPGGILGHCAELNAMGIEVLAPQQAVSRVRFELKSSG